MQFQTWLNMIKPSLTMKIVGTKLDNSDYERFADFCLKEEMTKSEVLRDLIKQYCQASEEDASTDDEPYSILEEPEDELVLESGKIYTKGGIWLGTLRGFEHKPMTRITISDAK